MTRQHESSDFSLKSGGDFPHAGPLTRLICISTASASKSSGWKRSSAPCQHTAITALIYEPRLGHIQGQVPRGSTWFDCAPSATYESSFMRNLLIAQFEVLQGVTQGRGPDPFLFCVANPWQISKWQIDLHISKQRTTITSIEYVKWTLKQLESEQAGIWQNGNSQRAHTRGASERIHKIAAFCHRGGLAMSSGCFAPSDRGFLSVQGEKQQRWGAGQNTWQ